MTEAVAPLQGIRVVDLSRVLAGPYCTMTLADLGADVIKVEDPAGGDPTRRWGPPFQGDNATYYLAANRNKRSLRLDLKSEQGRGEAMRLVGEADVVVENFRPGSSLQRLFDPDELVARHPRLVVAHISAFGDDGPLAGEPGYDLVAQAMGGVMSLTGEPDGPPLKVGFAIADLTAALFATIGILAALVERARTGRGRVVRTSLFEGQLALHTSWATGFFATGEVPRRLGSGHPNIVPYQAYAAADGHLVVAVGNDEMWRSLCGAIDRLDLREDDRFARNRDRVEHREALNLELARVFRTRPVEEWLSLLRRAGVPAAPIWSLDQVYAAEQTRVLEMIGTVEGLRQIRFPVTFDGERPPLRSAPPD